MARPTSRGPLPKADSDRSRSTAPAFEAVELGAKPVEGAPKLSRRALEKLHVETRQWWATVSTCPQASQFGATDWQRLRMVVLPLVDRFNRAVDPKPATRKRGEKTPAAPEPASDAEVVRLAKAIADHEAEFGLSPAARQRMRWTLRAPTSAPAEGDGDESKRPPRTPRKDPRKLALVK